MLRGRKKAYENAEYIPGYAAAEVSRLEDFVFGELGCRRKN